MAALGLESTMFDLSVVAVDGRWVLMDEAEGLLGDFDTRAEALMAAGDFAVTDQEPRYVLILDDGGEWDEAVVPPTSLH
jgi:hypothetical protein